jgi:arylsulfatase A-like enzyme
VLVTTTASTPKSYQAVAEADRLIGLILPGVEDAGMAKNTIVVITSDHGGKGKGHGGATMGEIKIPWILTGPGVAKGKELTTRVNTNDTAATVAFIFGLKTPRLLDCPACRRGVHHGYRRTVTQAQ